MPLVWISSSISVSYTHLDVYKRQEPVKFTVKDTQKVQTVVMKDAPTIKQINKVDSKTGKGLAGATPFSYTHLDVYKRQM